MANRNNSSTDTEWHVIGDLESKVIALTLHLNMVGNMYYSYSNKNGKVVH